MRRSPEFILSNVADNHILVSVGRRAVDFNAIISLNEMGVEIWDMLKAEKSEKEIVSAIVDEYEVSSEQAEKDVRAFLDVLRRNGCIIEK